MKLLKEENKAKHYVSVVKLDMNGKFVEKYNSIKEASAKNNIACETIVKVCKHYKKFKSIHNFIYIYEREWEDKYGL